MMASDASSSPKCFHSRSLDHMCGSIFEGIMQYSVPFEQQSLCLQRWDNGLQQWVYNGCTVRFVYGIFEYSFVLGIFDIFVLALIRIETSST